MMVITITKLQLNYLCFILLLFFLYLTV